jgi:hypothetical protein
VAVLEELMPYDEHDRWYDERRNAPQWYENLPAEPVPPCGAPLPPCRPATDRPRPKSLGDLGSWRTGNEWITAGKYRPYPGCNPEITHCASVNLGRYWHAYGPEYREGREGVADDESSATAAADAALVDLWGLTQ